MSFAFPGNWDGSSPLTFGEGEFVKDPDLPLGVTFQIDLQGNPDELLDAWGSTKVGVVGITTFTPETVSDGPEVTIARVTCPTKIVSGESVTGQVAYIQRAKDVMEIMWFVPTDQWESMQETFEGVLDNIELWRKYGNGKKVTYEAILIPNKDRLLEMITYAPSETWEDANKGSFGSLLGMTTDMRP